MPFATVTQAIDAVRSAEVDGALVPLENSIEGAVPATLDELAGNSEPLVIVAETYLPVLFDLLVRPGTALADVATLATHPHAEAQVRRFLLDALPDAAVTLLGSTAAGAAAVAAAEFDAAVAPPIAGELYGLEVLAHDIADHVGAVTRFVLLARPLPPPPRDRQRPHDPGRVPARGPLRCAAGDPDRVRHARGQPDPDRVAPDQGGPGPVLLQHRL